MRNKWSPPKDYVKIGVRFISEKNPIIVYCPRIDIIRGVFDSNTFGTRPYSCLSKDGREIKIYTNLVATIEYMEE